MRKITKLETKNIELPKLKRVAAYARVSVERGRTLHSYSAQVSYYNELIQKNPEWEFAGVYSDLGISGTGIEKRNDFKRLLQDCEEGKIDIILTKSISRFARNTVDLLNVVRHLKELGIEVRFEKEGISSLTGDGELMLSILASFAQEEVISTSNNIKWAIKKKFESGKPQCRYKIYGYRWDGDNLVIEPEEAKIVKLIFQMYLNKVSAERMEIELKEMGVIATNGGYFNIGTIRDMLLNITYTGNLLLQKSYTPNPLVRRKVKNNGQLPKYYVENNHEAIIPMEMFIQVQEERKRRKAEGQRANFGKNITCFSCRVKCPICGKNYMRNSRSKNSDGIKAHIWTCGTRLTGGSKACPGKTINEIALKRVSTKVLGLEEFDPEVFDELIEKVIVIGNDILEFHFNDGTVKQEKWEYNGKKESWTDERKKARSEKSKEMWRRKNEEKNNQN
ncbi:MAG: recombinase family protein [Erysipelotrichaceae bacterium]